MAIDKVSHSAVELVVGTADRCAVPLDELCVGLAIDANVLRKKRGGLEWPHFVELVERLEARIGYARLESSMAHLPDVAPDSRRLLSSFASPRLLVRFVGKWMGPSMYPMYRCSYSEGVDEAGRDTAFISMELQQGLRGCHTVFKLNAPGLAAVTSLIGLPASEVRAETGPGFGRYWLTLPPSQTLVAKLKRRIDPELNQALIELEEEKARLNELHEQLWRRRDTDFRVKLDEACRRWALTDRQVQVLSGLARGLSNKELANELRCSAKTVETHVTEVLRRASQDSRLSLVATFWREL